MLVGIIEIPAVYFSDLVAKTVELVADEVGETTSCRHCFSLH